MVINFKWRLNIIILKLREKIICKSQSTRILVIKRKKFEKRIIYILYVPQRPKLKGWPLAVHLEGNGILRHVT